jgi:hypothetical protein
MIQNIAVKLTVDANSTASARSADIYPPVRPLAVYLEGTVKTTSDEVFVFLTKAPEAVPVPQPGDPRAFDIRIRAWAATGVVRLIFPVHAMTQITEITALNLYVRNAHATEATEWLATLIFETV